MSYFTSHTAVRVQIPMLVPLKIHDLWSISFVDRAEHSAHMAFWCKEHAGLNTLRALVTIPRLATKEYGFLGFWILLKTKVKPTGYKYACDVRYGNIVISQSSSSWQLAVLISRRSWVRVPSLEPIRLWFMGFCITDQKQKRTLTGLYAGVAQQAVRLICNQQVVGSIPITSSNMGR